MRANQSFPWNHRAGSPCASQYKTRDHLAPETGQAELGQQLVRDPGQCVGSVTGIDVAVTGGQMGDTVSCIQRLDVVYCPTNNARRGLMSSRPQRNREVVSRRGGYRPGPAQKVVPSVTATCCEARATGRVRS
jgi:hypothetical protein